MHWVTNNLARYSCACHKNNKATRAAIKNDKGISSDLKSLSKFSGRAKKSIYQSIALNENNCRLITENKTRWSSSLLMLVSIKKAQSRNALYETLPVSIEKVDIYIQIFKPVYLFNIYLQRSNSSIAEIGPGILNILNKWTRMVVPDEYHGLISSPMEFHVYKFDYELNSRIYQVASILNVAKLHNWFKEGYAQPYVKSGDWIDAIIRVGLKFLLRKTSDVKIDSETLKSGESIMDISKATQNSDQSFFKASPTKDQPAQSVVKNIKEKDLENEVAKFLNILNSRPLKQFTSTTSFWYDRRTKLPNLYELSLMLLNIPAISAYIERYFSICGKMSEDLTIKRCLLTANIDLLNELSDELA